MISLDPQFVSDILQDILTVGAALEPRLKPKRSPAGCRPESDAVTARASLAATKPKVLSLEWIDPADLRRTLVPEMVELAGGRIVSVVRMRARAPWNGAKWRPASPT